MVAIRRGKKNQAITKFSGQETISKTEVKKAAKTYKASIAYENIIVVDPDLTWVGRAPVTELAEAFSLRSRWVPAHIGGKWLTTLLGALFGIGFFTLVWYALIPNIIFASIAGVVAGTAPGAGLGFVFSKGIYDLMFSKTPLARPLPFWAIRRTPNPPERHWVKGSGKRGRIPENPTSDIMQFIETLPANPAFSIEPVEHTLLMGRDPSSETPGVFLATSWAAKAEAKGVRRLFTATSGFTKTLQTVSYVGVTVCVIGVTLFLIILTMD